MSNKKAANNCDGDETRDQNKTPDDYEVGYGKPPKHTRFQKGVSGNPKGRPKQAPDFYAELLREAKSLITINENGRRIRIPKVQGIAKQATNKALTGNSNALKTYVGFYQQAFEMAALSASQSSDPGKYDHVDNLTDEELLWIVAKGLEGTEQKTNK